MQIDPATHLLKGADYIPSPNMDDRPEGSDINLLVIHSISLPPGEYGGDSIGQLFTNSLPADAHPYFQEIAQLQVSSHLLIQRTGTVVQYVPLDKRAWHAGESCFRERDCCNDFSIGIELEGTDEDAYTDVQYETLCAVVSALREAYPSLVEAPIVGHCDVAPERKTDPGPAFDWDRLGRELATRGALA